MNDQLTKLTAIAQAPKRRIIGLMSGTSLDGLDIALCEFEGSGTDTQVNLLEFETISYTDAFKADLKSVSFVQQVDLEMLTLLHAQIGSYFARLVIAALEKWGVLPADVDLIASHGQTIYHAPLSLHGKANYPNATLQIGDGDHLALKTGIITLSDFRQKHVAAGGEGAPLAVYGDYFMFSSSTENRLLLNIGGIANFTYLPAGGELSDLLSTDVGPGNTIMDQFVQRHYPGQHFDQDAALATAGKVHEELLHVLMDDVFFTLPLPRTTGPELFNLNYLTRAQVKSSTVDLPHEDVMATLCLFTATVITEAIRLVVPDLEVQIYVSGGGAHNPLLMAQLSDQLGRPLQNTSALGINPDAKEAVLFALLANECIAGELSAQHAADRIPAVRMGKISFPG